MGAPPDDTDAAALLRILVGLPRDDRAILERHLVRSPGVCRLDRRDVCIRRLAATHYQHLAARHRASAIGHDLDRESSLKSSSPPGSKRAALREVLGLNAGAPLSCQQLANILAGMRSPAANLQLAAMTTTLKADRSKDGHAITSLEVVRRHRQARA